MKKTGLKRTRALLALLVALVMALAACGGGGGTAAPTTAGASAAATDATTAAPAADGGDADATTAAPAADATTAAATTAAPADDGTVYQMRIVQPGDYPPDYDTGIAALNEKLLADGLSMEVSVNMIPWDAYAQKLNLMLTTGEEFEMLHIMQDVRNISSIAGIGAIMSLEGMIDDYPDLVGRFTDLEWQGSLYKGERYAVPAYWKSFAGGYGDIRLRTDVMNAVGYEEFPANDPAAILEMTGKMQDYILEETGIRAYSWWHQLSTVASWLHRTYDSWPFYVENSLGLVQMFQDGSIESFYESEEFKNDANYYYEMYQRGYTHPDILSQTDRNVMYDQADLGAFLPSATFEPIQEVNIRKNPGLENATVDNYQLAPEKPDMIYTFVQNLNGISSTAENPRSCLELLDWMYTNQENHDLFHYGIEGVHYTPVGDKRIEYMKDDTDKNLYGLATWMTGYLPYMRYAADAPDKQIAYMEYVSDNYVISPMAGFIFDASPVTAELTNLQTEIIASIYPIKFGIVKYDEAIGPAIERLKSAGLDAYLAEYRKQFQEYMDANPDLIEFSKGTTK